MHEPPRPRPPAAADRSAEARAPAAARSAVSGTGTPLQGGMRAELERSFGEDLSGVRLHEGAAAQQGVVGSHARALTVGDHVALGPGVQASDRRTLAHELAHVVQRRRAGSVSDSASSRGALELGAERAADRAAAGQAVGPLPALAVPAVQLAPLSFGSGSTLVVVDNGVVTVNGTVVPAKAGPDGRISLNNREVVLDRSGVMRYRDRYSICKVCNPDRYAGAKLGPGVEAPVKDMSFYDTSARRWVMRTEPVVTTATLSAGTTGAPATPGPVNPALQERVTSAHLMREQYEARVQDAMSHGRTRADAESLVRSRMQAGADPSGLGTFETGQTYAIVEEDLADGLVRRSTTGATAGETPTVSVPAPQLRARYTALNKALGENFVVNDQTLNHAEVRSIVRTPSADVYYVNRPMCPICQRYFLMESMVQGRKITVVGPDTTRVFTPDRRITEWRGDLVYERTATITREAGISTLQIGEHPSVTHSVRTVPRTTPVPAEGKPRTPSSGAVEEPHTVPRTTTPPVRPGVIEPEVPGGAGKTAGARGLRGRGVGIRRFGLAAGRLLAEGALSLAMLVFEVILQLIVIPYLEKLQRKLEEKYRALLEKQIQTYFETNLAARVQNRVLVAAEQLRTIEDNDAQPYVNTELRVKFHRSWSFWTGEQYGRPQSITDLEFVAIELVSVTVADSAVAEGSDPLVADDPSVIFGESRAQDWSQVVRFAAMPPSYAELVDEFGPNPATRAKPDCFIATACFGTPWAPAVDTLRAFRDLHLEPRARGRRLVDTYYRLSPPVAAYLRRHRLARFVVRHGFVAPAARLIHTTRLDRPMRPWVRARVELPQLPARAEG